MNPNDYFTYDDDIGALRWRVKRNSPGCVVGEIAGTINSSGRRVVELGGKKQLASRVIWEMLRGSIPPGMCIDHIDGNKLNDRIENLRVATLSENQRNRRLQKNCSMRIHGIYSRRHGFVVHCAGEYLGTAHDFFDACCMRKSAELRMGFHQNHGRSL